MRVRLSGSGYTRDIIRLYNGTLSGKQTKNTDAQLATIKITDNEPAHLLNLILRAIRVYNAVTKMRAKMFCLLFFLTNGDIIINRLPIVSFLKLYANNNIISYSLNH